MSTYSPFISKISSLALSLIAFLTPLVFLPFIPESFEGGKRVFIIFVALLAVIVFTLFSFIQRSLVIARTSLTVGFGILLLSSIVSIVFSAPNKMAALTGFGMFYIACSLLYLVASALIYERTTTKIVFAIAAAGVCTTVISALDRIGVSFNGLIGVQNSTATGIFPNGGPLLNAGLLTVGLVATITFFFTAKKTYEKVAAAAFSGLLALGLLLNGSLLLPGKPQAPVLMSFTDSWSIALDVLKNPRTALLGVGTESYANAFSIVRPVSMNRGDMWFLRFANARNLPLDMIVTHGVLGTVALALVGLGILNLLRQTYKEDTPLAAAVLTLIFYFLLFPINSMLFAVLTVLLIAWSVSVRSHRIAAENRAESQMILVSAANKSSKDERQVAFGVLSLACFVLLVLAGGSLFLNARSVYAKMTFYRALAAIRGNRAKDAYDLTRQAIQIAPHHEEFRRSFATTNLLIAQGLTSKEEISEADRKTALTLVQQSINEAKAAVALDAANTANWQTLAIVYQALIGAAKQADQWTVAAYVQAIQRAPSDPKLRVDLAGVFRKAKNIDQATRLLEQAVQLKPDYANAYFNLADVAKEVNKKPQQLQYLDRTLALIKTTDPNYAKVKEEADGLRKELEKQLQQLQENQAAVKQASTSATPTSSPTPIPKAAQLLEATGSAVPKITQPVELDNDAGIASPSGIPEVPSE